LPGLGVARQGPLQISLQDGGRFLHGPRSLRFGRRAPRFSVSAPAGGVQEKSAPAPSLGAVGFWGRGGGGRRGERRRFPEPTHRRDGPVRQRPGTPQLTRPGDKAMFSTRESRRRPPAPRRFVPNLKSLEGRLAPSAAVWTGQPDQLLSPAPLTSGGGLW